MKKSDFIHFQKSFFTHLTTGFNPVEVTIHKLGYDADEVYDLDDFVGGGTLQDTTTFKLKALFKKIVTEKDREKYGVDTNVSIIIYISPLELEQKTGSKTFPDYFMNSYAGYSLEFQKRLYEVERVIMLEEFFTTDEIMCMAYQFDLSREGGQ